MEEHASFSTKFFEEYGYSLNPVVDEEIYLAAFLAMWLSGRASSDPSTSVRLETFWIAFEMARGERYSLAVPHVYMDV